MQSAECERMARGVQSLCEKSHLHLNVRTSDPVSESNLNCLEGTDRHQTQLLPATLEDYVGADNPVRFLDAFVAALDLRAAGFRFPKENPDGRGRPPYAPADLPIEQCQRTVHSVSDVRPGCVDQPPLGRSVPVQHCAYSQRVNRKLTLGWLNA